MSDQSKTFSHYKQRNTFKALIGAAFLFNVGAATITNEADT